MSKERIAIITGANKGIGFGVVEGLLRKFNGIVYLTARDSNKGLAAVKKLQDLGLNPYFHKLDISDLNSIQEFKNHIEKEHGGIDILINNAAIAYQANSIEPMGEQARETLRINYFGTLNLCENLYHLLRINGRIVNVSSSLGHLSFIKCPTIKSALNEENISVDQLNHLMNQYIRNAIEDKHDEIGWNNSCTQAYSMSKVALTCLSRIQQKMFDAEKPNRNISVNSVHPGYVDTDLSLHKGPWTIEDGAKAILYLALEADLKGKYVWKDCTVFDWDATVIPNPY